MPTLNKAMFLVLDIGNTTHKVSVFNSDGGLETLFRYDELEISRLQNLFEQYDIEAAILSSVGSVREGIIFWLENHTALVRLTPGLKLPVCLDYETPETLGTDRIAAASGAQMLYPAQNVLVIQAGTCLVFDFVDNQGVYQGGSIAPGMRMRFQSLHDHTARLPLVEPHEVISITGKNTGESISSGVIRGMACEIDGFIDHYRSHYSDLKVLLTGGDAELLQSFIKNRIFAAPYLVLQGLYKILKLNVE